MARTFRRLAPSALAAALALLAAAPADAQGKLAEQTAAVPRETRVPIELSFEKATIFAVESQNDPKPADVEEAREKDPKDRTWVLLRFFYRNDGYTRQRVRIRAFLLDGDGAVLAEGGRSATLAKQKEEGIVSLPVRVGTIDWGRADRLKVLVTFRD